MGSINIFYTKIVNMLIKFVLHLQKIAILSFCSLTLNVTIMTTQQFEQDFNSVSTYLMGFAMKLTKDKHQAKDLFQETAFNAFKNKEKFQTDTNLKAWLSTIMKNSFISKLRKKKRSNELIDNTEEDMFINSGKESVLNEGETTVEFEELEAIINSLSDTLRLPFLLYYQGFQYDEIGEELNLPIGTIKSRIYYARKELKHKIQAIYN